MSWVDDRRGLGEVLELRPELSERYSAFLDAVGSSEQVPSRVMALCRARIEQIHGGEGAGVDAESCDRLACGDLEGFSAAERAALAVAERMPYQHHQMTDEEVEAVRTHLGDAGCVTLMTALAMFDMQARLQLTLVSEDS